MERKGLQRTEVGWLQTKIGEWGVRRSDADLRKVVAVYRSMSDEEIALILVAAAYARMGLDSKGILPKDSLALDTELDFEPHGLSAQSGV